jgi:uncharacterized protein YndB with AHSA1/START domain
MNQTSINPLMAKALTTRTSILIDALPARVWEVLITPKFIKQWFDLPVHFGDKILHHGTVIEWPGYSRLSVVGCEPNKQLKFLLYDPTWPEPPAHYSIAHVYTLAEENSQTLLTLVIGDFAQLADGNKYFEDADSFANDATLKIKELAES